jgi:O-antigen/teichoic acid export membrane protein
MGQGDNKKLFAYINAASRLLGRMTVLTLLFGFILLIAWRMGLGIVENYIWVALIMATFGIAMKFPELLYQSIYKGQEYYHKAAIFNMLNRFITLGAQFFLVLKGYSLGAIFTANLVVSIIVLVPQAYLVYRHLPGYRPYLFKSLPEKKELYNYGFWTWLQTIIAIVSYQLDRFPVAYFLGTATVTYYVLASTIVNHLHMAFEAAVSWLLPRVSRLKAASRDTLSYFTTVRAFSVGFSLFVIIGLYLASGPVFTLWLGPEKFDKMIVFFKLFLVFEAFLILSIVPKYYLNAIKSLTFITWLELMYKSAIVVGMVVVFYIMRTAESLITGQIIALIIFMPVEYFFVNKRIRLGHGFKEVFLTSLPSLCIMGSILVHEWIWSISFLIMAIVIFILVYVNDKRFDIKLFKE